MTTPSTAALAPRERGYDLAPNQSDSARSVSSAVSWGAIAAGAAAGASLSLILLILGVGLGLSSVSPWAREGISAAELWRIHHRVADAHPVAFVRDGSF